MSWQNKLESDLFSTLFACANKAQSENHHHYPHNTTGGAWGHSSKRIAKLYEQLHLYPFKQLTSGKYHASVTSSLSETKRFLLFFIQQKISRRCPWKTELFYTRYFSKRSANQQKQLLKDAFHVKQVSPPKISSILQKIKIGPESNLCPFCTKTFNYRSLMQVRP